MTTRPASAAVRFPIELPIKQESACTKTVRAQLYLTFPYVGIIQIR